MTEQTCQDDYLFKSDEEIYPWYWECTELDGHEGDHRAEGLDGQLFKTWPRGTGISGPVTMDKS